MSSNPSHFLIVGGASGVGKTTILNAFPSVPKLNTGDFFKQEMSLADRDSVRLGDWSQFEEAVANKVLATLKEILPSSTTMILDTHFAAKLHGRQYRIGLKRKLLFSMMLDLFRHADECGHSVSISVVLVYCDPYSLLRRRRLDTVRNRDLVPSDCIAALRQNTTNSTLYLYEAARARSRCEPKSDREIKYLRIENLDLGQAISRFGQTIGA